jgi:hypothetical protein
VTKRPLQEWAILAIAGITGVTGMVQMVAPGWVLHGLGAERTPTSAHFFAIVGMFMVVIGGAVLHALAGRMRVPVVLLWGSLQKFGAAAAVGLGVANRLFSDLALLVAGFDLASGVVMVDYWRRIRKPA